MKQEKLKKVLEDHAKGKRADLHETNLRGADLRWADLRGADLHEANLRWANFRWANLHGADLRWADLRGANLQEANLQGANLDFSCFPLWCGSFGMKADKRLLFQLICHITRIDFEEDKKTTEILNFLKQYGNEFCKYRKDIDLI